MSFFATLVTLLFVSFALSRRVFETTIATSQQDVNVKTDLDLDLLLPLELPHFTPSIVFVDLTVSKYCVDKVSLCTMLSVVLAI